MKLVSSNFREILPDRLTPMTGSVLLSEFEGAIRAQYALYGRPPRPHLGPCVALLHNKPYFNYEMLLDISTNWWAGTEESLIRYLGLQGRVPSSAGHATARPSLLRAVRALRLGRAASHAQAAAERTDFPKHLGILEQIEVAHRAFSGALLNHLLIGTATAIIHHLTDAFVRLLAQGEESADCHVFFSSRVETVSGLQQQAFRLLVNQALRVLERPGDRICSAQFEAGFAEYVASFGHRCVYELELAVQRPNEDPSGMKEHIFQIADGGLQSEAYTLQRRETTEPSSWVMDLVTRPLRAWLMRRERSKSFLSQRACELRHCILTAGEYLAGRGLRHRDEIFALTFAEMKEGLLSLESGLLQSLVDSRKENSERTKGLDLPEFLDTSSRQTVGADEPDGIGAGGSLSGTAVSRGIATGRIRKLESAEQALALRVNSILVVRGLDSSWNASLLLASGIIAEVGGTLSHAAIVAREHGIPAVFNVPGARARLPEGARVELNGNTGRITILSMPESDC